MASFVADIQTFVNQQISERPIAATLLLTLGFLSLSKVVFQTSIVLLQTFIFPGTSLKKFGATKGAWAVVTGASEGIGKEFSVQLGKAGFNIVLVARNREVLSQNAKEIEEKYKVKTLVHTIDFAKAGEADFEKFQSAVGSLDVGVLVNNVGKSHNMPVDFHETPKDEMRDIVNINVHGTLQATYAILPGMIQRRKGLILNIGSFAGSVASPMLATYSGTKAFLSTWSDALEAEVRSKGIIVEHANTYFVVSKLSKIRRASVMIPQPSPYVKAVLGKIGMACGAGFSGRPATSTPYWSHALLEYFITLVGMPSLFISYTLWLHKDIRRRALRKAAREAEKKAA